MLAKVTLAILLWMIWLFSGCSPAAAVDAVYMNRINIDMKTHQGDRLDVPTFILVPSFLHKYINVYVWMDNVKDKNDKLLRNEYLSSGGIWEPLVSNQLEPLITLNSFSPYYNYVLPYGIISGIKSFALNVCVKEFLSINIAHSIATIKASGVCGLRLITVN